MNSGISNTTNNNMNQDNKIALKVVLSGAQPNGNLHLGNYLGAIGNWLKMQNDYQCFFGIMNLHAITIPQKPTDLNNDIKITIATYLACGLDPLKITIFLQSKISAHSELAWLLSCITPLGWLNRMTQFKEKKLQSNNENLGLFAYPVLMAADILLYNANFVPVGADQKQHLELARDIAIAFNRLYQTEYFQIPEPLIMPSNSRIMSLQDCSKKMSKSDISDLSRINLCDSDDLIIKKIKKAKTDSSGTIEYTNNKSEIDNLINIFSALNGEKPQDIANKYQNLGYAKFKNDLTEAIIAKISPIRTKIHQLLQEPQYIKEIISEGSKKASIFANQQLQNIHDIIGFKI